MNADGRFSKPRASTARLSGRTVEGRPLEALRSSAVPVSPWSLTFAQASAEDLLRRMIEVVTDYKRALRKGRLAARRIRKNFTWDRTGRTLAEIVRTECERRRSNQNVRSNHR